VSDESNTKKENGLEQKFQEITTRINLTFKSILYINWILVLMGVAMFLAALYSAAGLLRWDITAVLSVTGFGDIFAVFKFTMNRLQRSLGDQVHVEIAAHGYIEQIKKIDKHFETNANINLEAINKEIRKAAFDSMELIQNFTEIGKPLKKKPWISRFPIRYEKLNFPSEVCVGKMITASGTLRNEGNEPINLTSIVIAVRPPFGTPSGGPFRFDFQIDPGRTLKPGESYTIKNTKCIEDSAREQGKKEDIPEKYLGNDWMVFMTCQTEDGYWHDDPNKISFGVVKKGATAK